MPYYYRDGKVIKKTKVPTEERVRLQREMENSEIVDQPILDTASVNSEPIDYQCLFEDGPATRQRFVNLQIVHLCEDHYFNSTLGRIVIQLRERNEYEPVLSNHQTSGS